MTSDRALRSALIAAVLVVALQSGSAHALTDALCGQAISGTVTLTEDLDCTGHPGAQSTNPPPGTFPGAAVTISANDTILDGSGCVATLGRNCRIMAPDSNYAVYAKNWRNVTIKNLSVDGWCNGTGIYIEGGNHTGADPGHLVENVQANGRSYGVDLRNTSRVTIRHLTTDSSASAGLRLRSVAAPLVLEDLSLTNGLVGLELDTFAGAGTYTFDATKLASLHGSDTGIKLTASVTGVTFKGLTIDGQTFGIDASAASNSNLVFEDLDVSATMGAGWGIQLGGAGSRIERVIANRRKIGVLAENATGLIVRNLTVNGAITTGLHLKANTAPITLEGLTLTNCGTALWIENYTPAAAVPYLVIGPSTITSLAESDTGIKLSNARRVQIGVPAADPLHPNFSLELDNPTIAVDARSTTNADLILTNIDLTSSRPPPGTGGNYIGVYIGGSGHTLNDLKIQNRNWGISLIGTSGTPASLSNIWSNRNRYGLSIESVVSGQDKPSFDRVDLTGNVTGLHLTGVKPSPAWVFDANMIDTSSTVSHINLTNCDNGIQVDGSENITFKDLVLDNPLMGINANVLNKGLTFDHDNFGGHGLGTGLMLGGPNHIVTDLVVSSREKGLYARATNNLAITRLTSNFSKYGLYLENHQTGTRPTLAGKIDLADNEYGIEIYIWYIAGNFFTPGADLSFDLSRTQNGLEIGDTIGLVIKGGAAALGGLPPLDNRARGIFLNTYNKDITLQDLDVSGHGAGAGIDVNAPHATRDGNIKLINITANHRASGVTMNGRGNTIQHLVATHNTYGLELQLGAADAPPTLSNIVLSDNVYGLYLNGFRPGAQYLIGPYAPDPLDPGDPLKGSGALVNTDGCIEGIRIWNTANVKIAGPTAPGNRLRIAGRSFGIHANDNLNSGLVLEGLDVSGDGAGTGIQATGTGVAVNSVTANRREYGVDLGGATNPTVNGLTAIGGAIAALRLGALDIPFTIPTATTPLTLTGLDLRDSKVGLLVDQVRFSVAGSLVIGATSVAAPWSGNVVDIRVSNVTVIAPATGPSVDAAGLGLSATSGGGTSDYKKAIAAPDPLCGSTLIPGVAPLGMDGVLTLGHDIDCRGMTGSAAAALTIGADDVTIDGSDGVGGKYQIVAPDGIPAILSNNRNRLTVHDLKVTRAFLGAVSSASSGIILSGGSGIRLANVEATSHLRGVAATSTPDLVIEGLTAIGNRTGLLLKSQTAALALANLTLTSNVDEGLRAELISGGGTLRLDNGVFLDLADNGTSIYLDGVDGVTVTGTATARLRLSALTRSGCALDASGSTNGVPNQNLELKHLDAAGDRNWAYGLCLSGWNHQVEDVLARNRDIGVWLKALNATTISNVDAVDSQYGVQLLGFGPTNDWPTFFAVDLRHCGVSLVLDSWTKEFSIGPDQFQGLNVDASATAIRVRTSSHLVFSRLALQNRTGIDATGANGDLGFEHLILTGTGFGYGLTLVGNGHHILDVSTQRHEVGVKAASADNLTITALTATNNLLAGLWLDTLPTGYSAPSLAGLTLTDNKVGLKLSGSDRAFELDNDVPSLALNVSRSRTGIDVTGSNLRFKNLALDNPDYGISATGTGFTFEAIDTTGHGAGTGMWLTGSGHTLKNVTSSFRDTGVFATATPSLAINLDPVTNRSLEATNDRVGLLLLNLASGQTPALDALDLKNNGTALVLQNWSAALTLQPGLGALSRSGTGIQTLGAVSNVIFQNLVLDNPDYGIRADVAANDLLTFDHVNVTGHGRGTGLALSGTNLRVKVLTANDRATGVSAKDTGALRIEGMVAANAGVQALSLKDVRVSPATPPLLMGLSLTNSAIGFAASNVVSPQATPLVLDGGVFTSLAGNLVPVSLGGGIKHLTLKDLTLVSPNIGIDAGTDSATVFNRNIRMENVVVAGYCRGTGVSLAGQDHTLTRQFKVQRLASGLNIGRGDRVTIEHAIIGANVKGVTVTGTSLVVDTTVESATVGTDGKVELIKVVGDVANVAVGQSLWIGGTEVVVAMIDLNQRLLGFSPKLTAVPAVGTTVRSWDYAQTPRRRVTMVDSDLCANGRGDAGHALSAGDQPVVATDDYWRASTGPTSVAANPGDFVAATTNATLSPVQPMPTDKSNEYCNQSPIPAPGPDQVVCEGDTVTLDGSQSYDPDCGAAHMSGCATPFISVAQADPTRELFTYQWRQLDGLAVALVDPTTAQSTFMAPTPPTGSTSTTLSFALTVADDIIPRTDTVSIVSRRRHGPPVASAGPGQTVAEGDAVTLVGTASDPEGLIASTTWIQTAGPAVALTNPSSLSPTFTAPTLPGGNPAVSATLSFELLATDTQPAGYCGGVRTALSTVSVEISNVNHPPVAEAGPVQTVVGGDEVSLSGFGSSAPVDSDGDPVSYTWTQESGPLVTILDGATLWPRFIAPTSGIASVVVLRITVADPWGAFATDTVSIYISPTCTPGDPSCGECLGVPDGTILQTDVPCGADSCERFRGTLSCVGGIRVTSCDAAYETLPDTQCPVGVSVAYAIVYDSDRVPRGTVRCQQDSAGAITCDEQPDTPGTLRVYDSLWCPDVAP